MSRSEYGFLGLGVVGLALRIGVALLSSGTNDILTWRSFSTLIDKYGVLYMYDNVPTFNYPPLIGYLGKVALNSSQAFRIPFSYCFKFPMILSDILTAFLLWKIWNERRGSEIGVLAVAAFGLSFDSILISSYHGNTDSLCAFLCLLAAYLFHKEFQFSAGLILAMALNVKLIPIVIIPAFLFCTRSWREMIRFCSGMVVGLLPLLPIVVCCGGNFYKNAVAYNSQVDNWGIFWFLFRGLKIPALKNLVTQIGNIYIPSGRYLILGSVVLLSLLHKIQGRQDIYELGALCLAIFLILTPGFGVQYLAIVCPLMFAVNLKWATIYSVLAGVFTFSIYYVFWLGKIPFHSQFTTIFPMPPSLLGLLTWVFLIRFAWRYIFHSTPEISAQ